jgi:hypothetical protein
VSSKIVKKKLWQERWAFPIFKSNGELQYYILMLGASCCTNLLILYSKDGCGSILSKIHDTLGCCYKLHANAKVVKL